ncbi:MAG: hypothetical protein GWN01_15690 [Nitrosopumilaceae archaeon]|nr:hypothetical protein [Nitrosopumilaceae archaeon]NIU88736.1 hypothetical protein [Nitrosopumilaceae archaeon]NIV66871.1 hypothetical protein [Nitrosopumilaceae archaeon]NIX62885.1 hypothetical protein [Nitrosopumilaceae archaeon]
MKISWKKSKGVLTGTVNTVKYGEVTVSVKKSVQGMNYEARFMQNTVIGRRGYVEDAKQLCIDYLEGLNLEVIGES